MSRPPVARLVFRELGAERVHIKSYGDVGLMKVDLDAIYTGEGWIRLRQGEDNRYSYDEYLKASSVVFYRSEVFGDNG